MAKKANGIQATAIYVLLGLYVTLLANSALLAVLDYDVLSFAYRGGLVFHLAAGALCPLPLLAFLVPHLLRMPHRQNIGGAVVGAVVSLSLFATLVTGGLLYVDRLADYKSTLLTAHVAAVAVTMAAFAGHLALRRARVRHFFAWPTGALLRRVGWRRHTYGRTLLFAIPALLLAVILLAPAADSAAAYAEAAMAPGLARTADGRYLHPHALGGSLSCGDAGCHAEVTEQWEQSAHHFSSFNNPYYRKSVEIMLADNAVAKTRWCASCHDPLLLMTGDLDTEDPAFMDRHAHARAGITCLACHAVVDVPDQTGNGNYVLEDPGYAALAGLPVGRSAELRKVVIETKPGPHGGALLSGALRGDKFCTSCHKVAVPAAVNDYRWKRGQNQYDAWRDSGFSGRHPRSFYAPERANCVSCHMPRVPSTEPGSEDGLIRSHRFAAANTALPYLNGHAEQLLAVKNNLRNDIAALDLFAVKINGKTFGPDDRLPEMRGGDAVELTLLVTNKNVGHGLPAGTNDSNEWWVAVTLSSSQQAPHLRSGAQNGEGIVDPDAHFLGATLIDEKGKRIDRRNVHEWYATVRNTSVPSGQTRLVRYRGVVPAGAEINRLSASLRMRKFRPDFNTLTFADDGRLLTEDQLTRITAFVEGTKIPLLPVVTVTTTERRAGAPYSPAMSAWKRWNNYGIGLLAEDNLPDAMKAFAEVDKLVPDREDGKLNQARVLLAEGSLEKAEALLRRAGSSLKVKYFLGKTLFEQGENAGAMEAWEDVAAAYPDDLVTLSDLGQLHYLRGDYATAETWLARARAIDPESYTVLYRSMLNAAAAGDRAAGSHWQTLYEKHKPNEAEEEAIAVYVKAHPTAQRELQQPHFHKLRPPAAKK